VADAFGVNSGHGTEVLQRLEEQQRMGRSVDIEPGLECLPADAGDPAAVDSQVADDQDNVAAPVTVLNHRSPALVRTRLLVVAVVSLIYFPIVWSVALRTDMEPHLFIAEQLAISGEGPSPYLLFAQLTTAVRAFLPVGELELVAPQVNARSFSWDLAGVLVVVGAVVVTADMVLRRLARSMEKSRRGHVLPLAGLATVGLMIVTPVTLLTLANQQLLTGYVGVNVYHNPTVTLSRPFALALFWLVTSRIYGRSRPTAVLLTAVMSVLVLMAKPSFTTCFLPAVVLTILWGWRRLRSVDWRLIGLGFVLPSVLVLGTQALRSPTGESSGLAFSPFEVLQRMLEPKGMSPWFFIVLLGASTLFPITVALSVPVALRHRGLRLAWLTLFVALVYFCLLEVTVYTDPGDFLWGAQIALFIVFVESTAVALQALGPGGTHDAEVERRLGLRRIATGTTFGLHVASGVVLAVVEIVAPARWW